jgi:hypothetical protein
VNSHDQIHAMLQACGLTAAGERPALTPLTGGVSSEIFRIDLPASLKGRDGADQADIDGTLIALDGTVNKSRLGGNAMVAVSMAALHAAAAGSGVPLWRHLAGESRVRIPMPEIQIFGGGAHAGGRTDIQDYVFESEPVAATNPLLSLPNVVVSPHVAWLTPETCDRSIRVAVENCRRLLADEPLLHRVV